MTEGPTSTCRLLSPPHPLSHFLLLVPRAQGLPFWSPGLSQAPDPPHQGLLFHQPRAAVSHLCRGVRGVTITPAGPPGKREVEVAGMRENRLPPLP